jgi:hypothetical protein
MMGELARALEGVKSYDTEFRVLGPDGTVQSLLAKSFLSICRVTTLFSPAPAGGLLASIIHD